MTIKLVLVRHGESVWNKENVFTGWQDVDLSETGVKEAHFAAKLLKDNNYEFDIAFTSYLKRAIRSCDIILTDTDHHWIPVHKHWRLNERHYGALETLNKKETARKYGEEQVTKWRRGFAIRPDIQPLDDPRCTLHKPCYKNFPKESLPLTESLKDCMERVMPYYYDVIAKELLQGKKAIMVGHCNAIRALLKHLENISDEEISQVNIPTGVPLVLEFDSELNYQKKYYLLDEEEVKKKEQQVANQAKL